MFEILNNICIRFIFRKRILFVFVFGQILIPNIIICTRIRSKKQYSLTSVLNRQRTNLFEPVKVQEQGEHMKTPEVFIPLNDLELLCTEFDYFDLCFNMFFPVMDRGRLFC